MTSARTDAPSKVKPTSLSVKKNRTKIPDQSFDNDLPVSANLKSHKKFNHDEAKMAQCSECEFKTSSGKAMKEHLRTHAVSCDCKMVPLLVFHFVAKPHQHTQGLVLPQSSADLPFSCDECVFKCQTKASLTVHMRVHTAERPYQCDWCDYTSKQSSNIRTHIKRKHAIQHKNYTAIAVPPKEDPSRYVSPLVV